ncbi:uncharacterized protein N0V89_001587 [Didymosphaeria variabile]|uniref:Uncharacterized protein n=1 Tax=Didymosphaeria variabile TaxID=1932322 RepID=A0A9W8XWU8_9PLEO|nr:uncharacterized protein N0V89_001587 [Didymosphaeria variabile]KAJ4361018.1 hypothetical protein N0V89_001587 [Didymosphaeria variabile]
MGTASSKQQVPTLAAKLSAKAKKKYKKIQGRSNALEPTSEAQSRPETCHWNKLSTELKLLIFEYSGLILEDPVRHPNATGASAKYQLRQLSFGLVNKEFRQLSQDVWYKKNTFVVAPVWVTDWIDAGPVGRTVLSYPNPSHGHLVRNLQVEFTVGWGRAVEDFAL